MTENNDLSNIPPDISPYLYEIAERLQTRHASVMIGTGFSKNVESGNKTKKIPLWKDLGDIFYDKLNGGSLDKKTKEYLDPLKLAEEVEAAFGRPALNNIIKSSIPDEEFQPSELHKKLLNLPWSDIFTTNYDTLLERTAENILQFRYETIINKEDLIWSTKPRIIKLHGSFPSERPFIITEEDYRTYPDRYAPFVNTVQQSLLENTLCLIGFSGDDPNFLSWIGWIRDNLGMENSPKMYLIGVLSLSMGQRKLLEDRNIIPIDISFFSKNKEHYDALSKFLDFLLENCHYEKNQKWPNEKYVQIDSMPEDINGQVKKVIEVWQTTRKEYPNWVIMPHNRRTSLWQNTLNCIPVYNIEKVERPNDIIILYEFNWRIEKNFHPLLSDWADAYRRVIDSYNPFPDKLNISESVDPIKSGNYDWGKIGEYWIDLQLSLLAFYRQEGMDSDWNIVSERLNEIENECSQEQIAKYHYEQCLKKLFSLDIHETEREIDLWATNVSLSYWEAKKAGLLAEIGHLDTAQSILETSLKDIRSKLPLRPVKDDYSDISQEAYILQLLDYVQRCINFSVRYSPENGKRHEEYRKRWRQITEYECDPWEELDHFESALKIKQPPYKRTEYTYGFRIGEQRITEKFGNDTYTIESYSFLKYMEEIGIPFRLPGMTFGREATGNALERIADFSPEWALVTLIRSGEEKNIDLLFNRKAMVKITQEYADELAETFLDVLNKTVDGISKGNSFGNRNFAVNLAIILPQILSRLCVKNSYHIRTKILSFIKDIYSSEKRNNYSKIAKLTEGLIESFSIYEQQQLFPQFLEFPVIPDNIMYKYPDPFQYIDIVDAKIANNLKIDNSIIENQLKVDFNQENHEDPELSASIRKKYITRLVVLWRYGLLNDNQKERFVNLLWAKRKQNGFPADLDYYDFAFMWFPCPGNIDANELFRQYVIQTEISFDGYSMKKNEVPMTGGHSSYFRNIAGTFNEDISYQWCNEEINTLIEKIINWWNKDKEKSSKVDDSNVDAIVNEYKLRFRNIISVFSSVIEPNIEKVDKKFSKDIVGLLQEFLDYNISNHTARASFIKIFPETEQVLVSDIENSLLSNSEERYSDALNAILTLTRQNNGNIAHIILLLSQRIKFRSRLCLGKSMNAFYRIIKSYPHYLNDSIIGNLNIGLENLLPESDLKNEDGMEDIHKKLKWRMDGIWLLLALKDYFVGNNCEIPSYMKIWEEHCCDKNEFSEIRNSWLDYI
jgi:hypothetical protein